LYIDLIGAGREFGYVVFAQVVAPTPADEADANEVLRSLELEPTLVPDE